MKYTTCLLKRYGKVLFVCVAAAVGAAVMLGSTCSVFNKAPTTPVISGPSAGVVGVPVTFKATATDPDGDSVAFQFDWGDTAAKTWSAFIASGETLSLAHTYSDSGSYLVKAKAKDAKGKASGLSDARALSLMSAGPAYPDTIVAKVHIPHGSAYNTVLTPDGRVLYIAHQNLDVITPMRVADRVLLDTVPIGGTGARLAVSADGGHLFACLSRPGKLVSINTASNVVEGEISFIANVHEVALSPDGHLAYVTAPDSHCLYVVETSAMLLVDTIPLGQSCYRVVISRDAATAYVSLGAGVGVVNTAEGRLVQTVMNDQAGGALALSPDGERVYVTLSSDSAYVRILTSTNAVGPQIKVSPWMYGISTTTDGEYVVVVDKDGLWYLDAESDVVVDTLRYHNAGVTPAVFPDGDTLYIPAWDTIYVVGKR
jgi:DNA-binding beta-propeller fold protein YncE